jgi:hypothetical protein
MGMRGADQGAVQPATRQQPVAGRSPRADGRAKVDWLAKAPWVRGPQVMSVLLVAVHEQPPRRGRYSLRVLKIVVPDER